MNDRFSLEELSIGVTHAVYRNTEVEDFHADGRVMDKAFYDDVYHIVSEKVAVLIKSMCLLICAYQNGLFAILDLKNVSADEMAFLQNIIFGIQCGSNWDVPHKMNLCPGDDIAGFLLDGEFKKYCDEKRIFNDSVMKPINEDIVDRVYCVLKHYVDKS